MSKKFLTIEEQASLINQKMELISAFKGFRDSVSVSGQETASMATVKEEVKKFCDKRIEEINGVRKARKLKPKVKKVDPIEEINKSEETKSL